MFITNIDAIPNDAYECSRQLGEYLVNKDLPILAINGNHYYFAKTDKLNELLAKMPFWMKMIGGMTWATH